MRKLRDWLTAYLQYTASTEAPDKLHFWTGVSVIAGALRRRVWIDQVFFQWTPNFYIVLVTPPGVVNKTTTIGIGMDLLKQVPGIKFGPKVVTWQALITSLTKATETVEVQAGKYIPMSCLTIESGEFGNFLNPSDRDMVDILVSLWDGRIETWEKVTKTQGSDKIRNPWLNIIACTTPAWIEGNFPEYLIGGGFTSRVIWLFTDTKRKLVAYPKDLVPVEEHKKLREDLIHDLCCISKLKGEFQLTKDFIEYGKQWYEEHYKNQPVHLKADRFQSYLARKQGHLHKLAMILAASESDDLVLYPIHLKRANTLMEAVEVDMPKVFDRIGISDMGKKATKIAQIVSTYGSLERKDLFKLVFSYMSYEEFEKAILACVHAKKVKVVTQNNSIYIKSVLSDEPCKPPPKDDGLLLQPLDE